MRHESADLVPDVPKRRVGARGNPYKSGMSEVSIDVRRVGLVELLLDFQTMALWEVLRRAGGPLAVGSLASRAGSSSAVTQSALDRLEEIGLVRRLRAGGRRRTGTYVVTGDRIAITGDLQRPDDAQLFRRYYERFAAHTEAVLGRGGFVELAERPEAWMHFFSEPVALSESELRGLRRRVGALTAYLKMARDRHVGTRGAKPEPCNYYAHFRVQPLRHAMLPQPEIVMLARGAAEPASAELGQWKSLSPREREVAMQLGAGSTQKEIAVALRISPNTVGTLTKRMYAKMGVRRRADLVNRLQWLGEGHDQAPPPRAAARG